MAVIFELYKIATWSSTKPNGKMEDIGNIFEQNRIVTWSSTKPNLKMEDGGNI
jgi:hypothetical protein